MDRTSSLDLQLLASDWKYFADPEEIDTRHMNDSNKSRSLMPGASSRSAAVMTEMAKRCQEGAHRTPQRRSYDEISRTYPTPRGDAEKQKNGRAMRGRQANEIRVLFREARRTQILQSGSKQMIDQRQYSRAAPRRCSQDAAIRLTVCFLESNGPPLSGVHDRQRLAPDITPPKSRAWNAP